jgi:putative sigma-54 modulation protein
MPRTPQVYDSHTPRISIRRCGVRFPSALEAYIQRRLRKAAAALGRRVTSLEVYIKDLNGPRGGVDKFCVITARLRSGRIVVAGQVHEGLIVSVDGAIRKMKRVLTRAVEGARTRRLDRTASVRTTAVERSGLSQ